MSFHTLKLDAFLGIVTDKSENLLSLDKSPDACNMDTRGGKLSVAKGFSRIFTSTLSSGSTYYRLLAIEQNGSLRVLACTSQGVYMHNPSDESWDRLLDLSQTAITPDGFDFQLAKIGSDERLLICCPNGHIYKWDFVSSSLTLFGSAAQLSDSGQNFLSLYYNRLFSAGNSDHPCRLYWSKAPGDGRTIEDWSYDENSPNVSGGHVEVGTDSDPITGLFAMSNQLVIFKRDSIYRLLGDRPSNFRILPVDATLDQPVHTAVVLRGDRLFFLTRAGLCYYDGQTVQHPSYGTALSGLLKGTDLSTCAASACGDRLYFAVKEHAQSPYNDVLIELDLTRECFMLKRGFSAVDLCSCHNKQYLLTKTGSICVMDGSSDYDGSSINAYWTTPLIDLGSKLTQKQLIELYAAGNGDIEIDVLADGATHTSYLSLNAECIRQAKLHGEGRMFRLRIRNRDGKSFSIDTGAEVLVDLQHRIM